MANATNRQGRLRRRNREGAVWEDKARGIWRGQATLPDGTRRNVQGASDQEVLDKLSEVQAKVRQGLPAGGIGTLGEFVAWWLDVKAAKVASGKMSPNTLENHAWALGKVSAVLGAYKLIDLDPEIHIEPLLARLAAEDSSRSRSSVVRVRSSLAQVLDTALKRGKVYRNAARLAEMPETKAPLERRALTADQAEALLAAAEGDPLEAYLVVGLLTGLRPGELLGLQWSGVDLEAGTLAVRGSLKREPGGLVLGDVKRGIRQSRRTISLVPRAVEALRAHQVALKEQRLRLGPAWKEMDLVFPSERGTPMGPSNLRRRIDRITERAGLGHLTLTELGRHTLTSLLADDEVPTEKIADLLGHASNRMVERHYRHRVQLSIDAGVATMDKLFPAAKTGRS